MLHRWREWRKVMTVLAGAYILYLPWGIVVLANLGSFSVSQPGVGGGFTLHLLLWGLAAAGAVVCYLHKKQYYLLPAYLLSMVPIAFFYSHRFWEGHVFLPLAMLGGVALDRLHAFLKERLSRRSSTASYARAMAVGSLVLILLLALFADPVIASTQNRPALVGQRAVGGYGTAPRIPGGAQPPAGYEGGVLTPRGQGYSSVPGVDTPGFPTGEGYVPSPPSGYSPARPRPGDTRPLNGLPSGGDGDAPALPLRALRDLNRDSVTLSMRPTTIPVLLGLEDSQPHMGSGQEVFGDETMELMEIITQNSEPTDIVFACDGRLGDLIYTMTGRYSTQGMFHEVQPESETDPLTEADLAVVPAGPTRLSGGSLPGGRGEPGGLDDWTLAGRAGTYAVYISESAEETEGGVSSAVLPLWVAYALLLACILAVIIDVARKRSGHGPPRGSSPTQPYGNPTGGGAQDSNTVIAVVPAHNEEENIAETVGEIRSVCPGLDVLVVDDGSTDSTGIEALNSGAMVIALEENLGVGEAERRGLYYAYSHGYGYAVRLDGDGQHPASAIADLLAALCGEEADVVVGSRFLRTAGGEYDVSRPRRWGIAYFRVLLRLSSRLHFTDPTSGFRAYSRRAMSLVCRSEPPRYPEVTSLRLFARNGLKVCEVPVLMRARMRGRSTLGAWRAVSLIAVATLDLMRPPFLLSPAGTRESALA
jgi:hypothetical protein